MFNSSSPQEDKSNALLPIKSQASHSPRQHTGSANPSLEDLIRVSVPPPNREYGLSLVKLLDGKPNVSWDERGNLFPPFSGLNIIDIINSLGNTIGKISTEKKNTNEAVIHSI